MAIGFHYNYKYYSSVINSILENLCLDGSNAFELFLTIVEVITAFRAGGVTLKIVSSGRVKTKY